LTSEKTLHPDNRPIQTKIPRASNGRLFFVRGKQTGLLSSYKKPQPEAGYRFTGIGSGKPDTQADATDRHSEVVPPSEAFTQENVSRQGQTVFDLAD
jgi:hypothetical protein